MNVAEKLDIRSQQFRSDFVDTGGKGGVVWVEAGGGTGDFVDCAVVD